MRLTRVRGGPGKRLKGDDWHPLKWDSLNDAITAALKIRGVDGKPVFPSGKEARESFNHVSEIVRLAHSDVTEGDVYLHYWNLVEVFRTGGTYDEWLERSAL